MYSSFVVWLLKKGVRGGVLRLGTPHRHRQSGLLHQGKYCKQLKVMLLYVAKLYFNTSTF